MPSELAPISSRLNDLLARLQQAFEHEREFSADLAHELRTPIAELRSLAEFGLQWPESRGDQANVDAIAVADQMENIVTQLLALRRSETGQLFVEREQILIAPLIEDIWQSLERSAQKKNLLVPRNIPENLELQSDPVLLRSILTNLIENAVEYTPTDGAVRIEAAEGGGWFTVRVANTVEHLQSADLPKLFERLWRKDSSRSNQKHSGLGLSLSRAFARVLGCELNANLEDNKTLIMTFSGPSVFAYRSKNLSAG
jgi:two-component system sensor histidine kinase QseC